MEDSCDMQRWSAYGQSAETAAVRHIGQGRHHAGNHAAAGCGLNPDGDAVQTGPWVYGCMGRANNSSVRASSTRFPRYMTRTLWQSGPWPPSHGYKQDRHPIRSFSSAIRFKISRMVTSNAVVGSSANQQFRLTGKGHGNHHALHTAGQLVRILSHTIFRIWYACPDTSSSPHRSFALCFVIFLCRTSTSDSCLPIGVHRAYEVMGS